MLFRDDGDGVIAIPQPSHAWLSGQMMRSWGNGAFHPPSPCEEVCLGAEQHDIGWLSWEAEPTLNPQTGLPHNFQELDVATHTKIWTQGVRRALTFGWYPALLVSLHADTIYGTFFDFDKASQEDAALVRQFLTEQHRFQLDCVAALTGNSRYTAALTPQALERNRLLIAAVDRMSLAICWGVKEEVVIPGVPTAGEARVALRIGAVGGNPADLQVDPWPFETGRVELVCEGRRLRGHFTDTPSMRRTLRGAEAVTILTVLSPR